MADFRAMTSGFDSKSMGSGGGGGIPICCDGCDECVNGCLGGGRFVGDGAVSGGSVGARGGVIGDMGGRTGDVDRDRDRDRDRVALSIDIVKAGMAKMWGGL